MGTHKRPMQVKYVVVIIAVSYFFMFSAVTIYTHSVFRALCALVAVFDDSYKEFPPSTPTGAEVQARMHVLRERLWC